MSPRWRITMVGFLFLLAGCSMKQVGQGIYAGAQDRNQLLTPPAERLGKTAYPTYGEYEQQRTGILERDSGSGNRIP